jgi:hypothetical protein
MTRIIFKYDVDKDTDNFIRGTRAKNSSKPTKLQEAYVTQNGTDYDESKVTKFLELYRRKISFDSEKSAKELEKNWEEIEMLFLERVESIFKIAYPASQIIAYLTTNQRCTYNIPENYFFINFSSKSQNRTVMHELLHFYMWHALHNDMIAAGINENQYNDIKESLTVLLNTEFADLMGGVHDDGYPQHAEMRQRVQELWNVSKDIRKVVFGVFSLLDSSA